MAPNAVSRPSFICRPSSLAGPLNGAALPKRISLSVTPLTLAPRGMLKAAVCVGAAVADAGAPAIGTAADAAAIFVGAAVSSDVAGGGGGVTMTVWTARDEFEASCGVDDAGADAGLLNF